MADRIRVMIVDDIVETREQLRKLLSFDLMSRWWRWSRRARLRSQR